MGDSFNPSLGLPYLALPIKVLRRPSLGSIVPILMVGGPGKCSIKYLGDGDNGTGKNAYY